MPEKKSLIRIPAEESQAWSSWALPFVADNGKVLPTVENQKKDSIIEKKKKETETIEDVYFDKYPALKGMKADLLQEIIVAAEQEGLVKGHKEGFERGHAEGCEAGRIKGYADTQQKLLDEQNTFTSLINALVNPLRAANDKVDVLLLEIVQRLTRSVIRRELLLDSGDILKVVNNAIDALPSGWQTVCIQLNPNDFDIVETYNQAHQLNWVLKPNNDITPGGVYVTTEDSAVDDTIKRRLSNVLADFLEQKNVDESFDELAASSPTTDMRDKHDHHDPVDESDVGEGAMKQIQTPSNDRDESSFSVPDNQIPPADET